MSERPPLKSTFAGIAGILAAAVAGMAAGDAAALQRDGAE